MEGFSVIMPTYNQASFIRKAIHSLFGQTISKWELIIINDGSTDETYKYIEDFLSDPRIIYIENEVNKGLGAAINQGLAISCYNYISYLPSDDFYYEDHLECLQKELNSSEDVVLTYSRTSSMILDSITAEFKGQINGLYYHNSLQLVQTAHRKTSDQWVERSEKVSSDLFELYWGKLTNKGAFTFVDKETSCWSIHKFQHHKLVSENLGGGVNIFRKYYNVQEPLKIKVSTSKFVDEEEMYKNYRLPKVVEQNVPLKILLVGELAYNPERIYALEESGCKLYGLWMQSPTFSFSTVGPLPFGNVIDISYDNWEGEIKEVKPDIIYACLNFGSIELAHEVLTKTNVPFVWHFKEGPFLSRQNGTWNKLIELYDKADGKIYINEESRQWYEQFIPKSGGLSFILDGDLPKANCFTEDYSPCKSSIDNEIHTVAPGRIIGLDLDEVKLLAQSRIHIHSYLENYHDLHAEFNREAMKVAPNHFHLHPHCASQDWVSEFSKYDAGWLHCFQSHNNGDLKKATWNDLNMPARMNTLAAAGLPMIQKNNSGHIVAMQSHVKSNKAGIFYDTIEDLALKLKNKNLMISIRNNVRCNRHQFCFDNYVPQLISFFQEVIKLQK